MSAARRSSRAAFAGASLTVIAALLPAAPLRAAAFQGVPVVSLGAVSIDRSTPNVDNIFVDTSTATINWTPSDKAMGGGPIAFLGSNGTVNFFSVEQPYTVLNRIIAADASRVISFDGRVNSDAVGAIWFYAPGGILIGGKASFNVGSLLLTANDPITDANGEFLKGSSFSLAAASGSTAAITIDPGARIAALATGSYVIAVAPRIDQGGAIDVNGAAALVAGEAVDLTLNAGLFDITVTTGTAAGGDVLRHNGTLTGAAAAAGANHRIYLVAMPKNDAITLYVGGTNSVLGFDIAGAANVVGNAIILSAGRNIAGGAIAGPQSQIKADVTIDEGQYSSALTASSTGETRAASLTGGSDFASNLDLTGRNRAEISAFTGFTVKISGNASLSTTARSPELDDGAARLGGTTVLAADGGTLTIAGTLALAADGYGNASSQGRGGIGTGGIATIGAARGGTITVIGATTASAQGFGGNSSSIGAGDGIGGTVSIATNSGSLSLGGGLAALASGFGGDFNADGPPAEAPRGSGGRVEVRASNGALGIGGALTLRAEGIGNAMTASDGNGSAAGGSVMVSASGSVLTVAGAAILSANAAGSGASNQAAFDGGSGKGGTVQVLAGREGAIVFNGPDVRLSAFGLAGDSVLGSGGVATGGAARIETADGGGVTIDGALTLDASAEAGSSVIGNGGAAQGGTASLTFGGGTTRVNSTLDLLAEAFGGSTSGGIGGDASGGTITIASGPGGSTAVFAAPVRTSSRGEGGNGGSGGKASGGAQTVTAATGSTLTFSSGVSIFAEAFGGSGSAGAGGTATGGTVGFTIGGTAGIAGLASVDVSATGGDANGFGQATGGAARGGTAALSAVGGNFDLTGLDVVASGRGGESSGGGGTGSGGSALLSASESARLAIAGDYVVTADGIAGDAFNTGLPGATGTGGIIRSNAAGGQLNIGGVHTATAQGFGGTGNAGGTGSGGSIFFGSVAAPFASTATLGGVMIADASGRGGAALDNTGGSGGSGAGGRIDVAIDAADGTATLAMSDLQLTANGVGGTGSTLEFGEGASTGGNGGDGDGGSVFSGSTSSAGALTIGNAILLAQGVGGNGGGTSFGNGGVGGNGRGGDARAGSGSIASAQTGSLRWTTLTLQATGSGGIGSSGGEGNDGAGGNGFGGLALLGASGGAIEIAAGVILSADGRGGSTGNSGAGGNGFGGTARTVVAPHATPGGASSIAAASLAATASGVGGSGATTGTTAYGSAIIDVIGGSASFGLATLTAIGATPAAPGAVSGVSVRTGSVAITGGLDVASPGNLVLGADDGSITVGGALTYVAGGGVTPNFDGRALTLPGIVRAQSIAIRAGQGIVTSSLASGSTLSLDAQTAITASTLTALGNIDVAALGAVQLGAVAGGGARVRIDAGASLATGIIRGDGDVGLRAPGDITTGTISAGDSIDIRSQNGGNPSGRVVTGALDAGIVAPSIDPQAAYQIGVIGDGDTRTGALTAQGNIGIASRRGAVSVGDVATQRSFLALGITDIATGSLATGNGASDAVYLGNFTPFAGNFDFDVLGPPGGFDFAAIVATTPVAVSGTISVGGGVTTGIFKATSLGVLTVLGPISTGSILALDGGALLLDDVFSGGLLSLISASDLTVGDIRADGDIVLTTPRNLTAGQVSAGDSVFLTAGADITVAGIDAGIVNAAEAGNPGYDVLVKAGGADLIGDVGAQGSIVIVSKGGSLTAGDLDAGRTVALLDIDGISAGRITTGNGGNVLMASDAMASLIALDANGNLDLGALLAAQVVALDGAVTATGPITTGTLTIAATGGVTIPGAITTRRETAIRGGTLALGGIDAGDRVTLEAGAGLTAGAVRGDTDISIMASLGDIVTGTVSAGGSIHLRAAEGRVTTAALDAGIVDPAEEADHHIGISGRSGVDAATGATLRARGTIGIEAANGSVATGAATAGRSFVVLAADTVTTGAIATGASAADWTYVGNASLREQVPNLRFDPLGPPLGFDFAPLFALTPVRVGGSLALGGAVATGTLASADARGFSAAGPITASQRIAIDSGRTARFAGATVAPRIAITSADIEIAAEASIGNAATTQLSLRVDQAATAIQLGGTLSAGEGVAWQLDAAEIGRLRAGQISVDAAAAQPPVVQVAAFALVGTAGGASGNANFALNTPGAIRVGGAVTASNLAATDTLRLQAGSRLTIVTDSGGALLLGGSGAADSAGSLGGILDLAAPQIWVGTAALLGQLAENASFAGRDAALGAAPATPNLAGEIGGASILVSSTSFLVQNSGDATRRAGFSVGPAGLQISSRAETQADVVINGRAFDSLGATLVNNDTIALVAFKPALASFTATSSVNGCIIGAVCTAAPEGPGDGFGDRLALIATQVRELTVERQDARARNREPFDRLPQLRFAKLIDLAPAIGNPAIDEPITSGGNSSLWLGSGASEPPPQPAPGEQK